MKSLFYCCLHSDSHAVILQPNISLQLLREKENVTQELEILQSSAACSTTSSLDVVSNKVRLLEKNNNKKKKNQIFGFFSFPVGTGTPQGGQRFWEFLVGWEFLLELSWAGDVEKFGVVGREILAGGNRNSWVWDYPG